MKWLYPLGLLLAAGIGFRAGRGRMPEPVVRRDTIVRTEVRPERVEVLRYIRDTLHTRDTVRIEVFVPIQKYVFADTLYRAEVSGYGVTLDRIEIYRPTIVERVRVPKRWGIGLSAGYCLGKNGFSPYIGIGINYNIFCF